MAELGPGPYLVILGVPTAVGSIVTTMSTSPHTFGGPDADVILRAPLQPGSDEFEDFHVHKLILSIASRIFQDTFSIPRPPRRTSEDTALDVVNVEETAKVLETFLQLIYPVQPPVFDDLQLVDDLFRVTDKYGVDGVYAKLTKILVSPSFLKGDPIGVYAIACRNNLDEETKLAVSHTFSINVVSNTSERNLQAMTAKTYHRLLAEHAHRREQLIDAVNAAQRSWDLASVCCCGRGEKFMKEICLELSKRPFLDRETLEGCISPYMQGSACRASSGCTLNFGAGSRFMSAIIQKIQKI